MEHFSETAIVASNGEDNQNEITVEPATKSKASSKGQNAERYVDAFPPLGGTPAASGATSPMSQALPWVTHVSSPKKSAAVPPSSIVTQIFTIPLEERKYRDNNKFGANDNQREIQDIIRNFPDVNIEVASSRDRSLTVVLSGRATSVSKAKASVLSRLQTQTSSQIKIPQEHHRNILGKQGLRLREIEAACSTKIQLPRFDEHSDLITISGTKEAIEKARHELQMIADELSKLAFERLKVPKIYHPFIRGPFDRKLVELRESTGSRINVPPFSVNNDEITVDGEKEAVQRAVKHIMQIYDDMKKNSTVVSVEVRKSQHKYIIGSKGSGLSEILESTGVSVEMPNSESSSETIMLRGDASKVGLALTLVYSKAESQQQLSVEAPAWLHRFIIGKGGQTLSQITQGKPKVHISFSEDEERITIEGPKEEVVEVQTQIKSIVDDLKKRMKMDEVRINPLFHKHIIGKAGINIKRIKEDTGCDIFIPSEEGKSKNDVIRIEGNPAGVEQARKELLALAEKLGNEKSKDVIIEQRFHRILIGQQGSKISALKDEFPEVKINFPDVKENSDIVTLRGPCDQVVGADKLLSKMYKDTREANYEVDVKIFKQFHKNIIGKGGATIRKIREETGTRIQLPDEFSDSDIIKIIGSRKEAEEAGRRIEAIQRELVNIAEVDLQVPHRLHTAIIGPKGRFIKQVQDECGGVQIHFPSSDQAGSDVVRIRGPKSDVEKARRLLEELVAEKREASFELVVRAKPEFHKFIIGRRGANIEKIRNETSARLVFPERDDEDQESITIIGRKDAIAAAEKLLLNRIAALSNVVEKEISVDPKWHKHFVQRRGELLNSLSEEYGGVVMSFPKNRELQSDKVRVKGPSECVDDAIKRLLHIVEELQNEVTVNVVLSSKYHRSLIGRNGCNVQAISSEFNVNIKFPTRGGAVEVNGEDLLVENGHAANNDEVMAVTAAVNDQQEEDASNNSTECNAAVAVESEELTDPSDIVSISGQSEQCELAKAALLALVPVTQSVHVPLEFHRLVIGSKGSNIRQFNDLFEVQIKVPAEDTGSDELIMIGAPAKLILAQAELDKQLSKWNEEKAERDARNFQVKAVVPNCYHRQIIGTRGSVIQKIKASYGDSIQRIDIPSQDKECNEITIIGYREQAEACAAELEALARQFASYVTDELFIVSAVHPRLIGKGGRNLARLCEQFNVEINFPGRDAVGEEANLIQVRGPQDKVDDACDYIVNLASEWLDEMREHGELDEHALKGNSNSNNGNGFTAEFKSGGPVFQNGNAGGKGKKAAGNSKDHAHPPGFKVVDAPWDSNSQDDFPSISNGEKISCGSTTTPPISSYSKWGGRHN